ncbi:MAG: hypothetical protein ACOCRK_06595, partial [bacterium]
SYFNFLNHFEKKDIKYNILDKFAKFMEYLVSVKYIKSPIYTFKSKRDQVLYDKETDIYIRSKVEFDIISSNGSFSSGNHYYLDFLVLKTGEDEDPIFEAIKELKYMDIFLSHSPDTRYYNKKKELAINIAQEIKQTDFSKIIANNSKFCKFCLISDLCKEDHLYKEEEDEY